jgi:hypothetical protein
MQTSFTAKGAKENLKIKSGRAKVFTAEDAEFAGGAEKKQAEKRLRRIGDFSFAASAAAAWREVKECPFSSCAGRAIRERSKRRGFRWVLFHWLSVLCARLTNGVIADSLFHR